MRRFRGAIYRIKVRKGRGTSGRVASLTVDGQQVEGKVVPLAREGAEVTVEASIED